MYLAHKACNGFAKACACAAPAFQLGTTFFLRNKVSLDIQAECDDCEERECLLLAAVRSERYSMFLLGYGSILTRAQRNRVGQSTLVAACRQQEASYLKIDSQASHLQHVMD